MQGTHGDAEAASSSTADSAASIFAGSAGIAAAATVCQGASNTGNSNVTCSDPGKDSSAQTGLCACRALKNDTEAASSSTAVPAASILSFAGSTGTAAVAAACQDISNRGIGDVVFSEGRSIPLAAWKGVSLGPEPRSEPFPVPCNESPVNIMTNTWS